VIRGLVILAGAAVLVRLAWELHERRQPTPCRVCGLMGDAHELACPYVIDGDRWAVFN
jgi:hypothetical protein